MAALAKLHQAAVVHFVRCFVHRSFLRRPSPDLLARAAAAAPPSPLTDIANAAYVETPSRSAIITAGGFGARGRSCSAGVRTGR